jgi:hypothetical protein
VLVELLEVLSKDKVVLYVAPIRKIVADGHARRCSICAAVPMPPRAIPWQICTPAFR